MEGTNSYSWSLIAQQGTASETELYGPQPYDTNFVFPIHPESWETERVKLVPFVPRIHVQVLWAGLEKVPDLLRYYPSAWPTLESFLAYMEFHVRRTPRNMLFTVIDKTKPDLEHPEFEGGSIAGVMGLYHASVEQLSAEISFVAILPPFQRTHVASNATGILLRYCLNLPSANPPGLGLRRVQWCAHPKNVGSVKLAERMGFKQEGVTRWMWVLPPELTQDGEKPREGDQWPEKPGRHTVKLSVCWDDWEGGISQVMQNNMDRVA